MAGLVPAIYDFVLSRESPWMPGSSPGMTNMGAAPVRMVGFAMIKEMIKELSPVVLTKPLPEHRLHAGDVGWVVMVHDSGTGYEIEFVTLAGDTVSVVTVSAKDVRPGQAKEIVHARRVARRRPMEGQIWFGTIPAAREGSSRR